VAGSTLSRRASWLVPDSQFLMVNLVRALRAGR
jgi:hypothetical protein